MSEQKNAAATDDAWTVIRLLKWTTDFFRKRGSESPRLEAEVLLAHALNCTRIELYTAFGTEPNAAQKDSFRNMVKRRGDGVPVAYLVGYREFYSLRLSVTPAVLIPRPETEHVVIEALDRAKAFAQLSLSRPLRIVDVGTGSGAIAIAVAKHLESVYPGGASVTAIDVSPEALAIAKSNAEANGVSDQIKFEVGNLLATLPCEPSLDLVLSNPPYVSESEFAELDPMVRDHEPKLALVSGQRGTELIQPLIGQAADRLYPGGQLIIELSPMIADAVAKIVTEDGRYSPPKFIKDLAGHRRVLSVTRSNL
jgi:release factor glutamine methyltransferase